MDFTVIIQIIVKLFENPIAIFFAFFLFLLLSSSFILKLLFFMTSIVWRNSSVCALGRVNFNLLLVTSL